MVQVNIKNCVYPDSIIDCQGRRRTRKLGRAQQSSSTRSRRPACHRRIRSLTRRESREMLGVITPPQSGGLDGCEQPSGLPGSSVTL
jgi:hypothetical protein